MCDGLGVQTVLGHWTLDFGHGATLNFGRDGDLGH